MTYKFAMPAPEVVALNNQARDDALKSVGNIFLGGTAVGAGGAGLLALKQWLARPKPISSEIGLGPSEVDLPYPQFEGADITPAEAAQIKKRKALADREKLATPTPPAAAPPGVAGAAGDWLAGKTHMDPNSMPWYMPAGVLAGIGGVAGGASLVNWMAEKRRKAEQAREVEDAKQEFEEAMMSQYSPSNTHRLLAPKQAGLDDLFDRCKEAGFAKVAGTVNDLAGTAAGGYLTLASLLGLGTGYGTYKYLEGRSKSKQIEKAIRDRAALRATANPPEMFIHPVAVNRPRPLSAEQDASTDPSPF
jgi:hypothetical protein